MTSFQTSSSEDRENSDLAGGVALSPARSLAAGAATPNFTDKGGLVLQNVHVQLIFWGTAWGMGGDHLTINDVTSAVTSILSGPYMSLLDQYRHIGNGVLNGTTSVMTPVASSPADPPNPFSKLDVPTLIWNLINSGAIPNPASNNQLLYCVIMPPGVHFTNQDMIGNHTFFPFGHKKVHFAWVSNDGTLASITKVFSHELVEACTDPEGTGILGASDTCTEGGWCEIGDVCENQVEVVDDITLQSYWSQKDRMCVVPS